DLGNGTQSVGLGNRKEQAQLDPIAGEERHAFQHLTPAGVLAGERLHHAGELRKEQVEQRSGGQLGDPASALGLNLRAELQRAPVEALDILHLGIAQQRPEQAVDELGVDVADVSVNPADQVALQ